MILRCEDCKGYFDTVLEFDAHNEGCNRLYKMQDNLDLAIETIKDVIIWSNDEEIVKNCVDALTKLGVNNMDKSDAV